MYLIQSKKCSILQKELVIRNSIRLDLVKLKENRNVFEKNGYNYI